MHKVKVLFLSADPLSASPGGRGPRLLLDEEVRQIQQQVLAAEPRLQLEFDMRLAARLGDLPRALLDARPQVVHFSGHGSRDGLVLVGADGGPQSVSAAALVNLFQLFSGDIRLVVLNAADSLPHAEAIAEIVGCAIGMGAQISDRAAITFAAALYRGIAFGYSVQAAFDQARGTVALEHPEEQNSARLVCRSDVDPARLDLIASGGADTAVLTPNEDDKRGGRPPLTQPHVRSANSTAHSRSTIFISYSHKDRRWLERLQVHLKPLEHEGLITPWDDTKIKPGTQWRAAIERALDSARVAVLLISADFLASDYIRNNELPPLLEAAGADGATIFPLIVSACRFSRESSLAKFQAVNDPARPLDTLTRARQEGVFDRLSEAIEQALLT
jgi:hypothetical protein